MKNRFQTMIKRIALLGMSVFLLAGAWAQEPVRAPFLSSADDRQCRQWVDSVMSRMNLHEKIGQLLVPKVMAVETKETKKQVKEWVKKYKVGGLLFGKGTPEEQAILTNLAQKTARVPCGAV